MNVRISQVARQVGLAPSAIRYYEEIGLLPKASRAKNNYRVYQPSEIERLHVIKRARELGFTLAQIREIFGLRANNQRPCPYVMEHIDAKIAAIERQMEELAELKAKLEQLQDESFLRVPVASESDSCICAILEKER